jgi:hypothetical protein
MTRQMTQRQRTEAEPVASRSRVRGIAGLGYPVK